MSGIYQLMDRLLYGSGLQLMECLRQRVEDVDFASALSPCTMAKENKTG
jgi:integrase